MADITELIRDTEELMELFGPLVRRYLLLRKNCDLCGVPRSERLYLNLRRCDWPGQHKMMVQADCFRLLGFKVLWI